MADLSRAKDKVARLAGRGLDLVSFWRQTTEVVAAAVPYYDHPCWFTLDPASLLITSHYNPSMPELPGEFFAAEYYEDDVNKLVDVARSASGLSTLHDATDGDPSRSPRWHANMRYGGDQELIAALRTQSGEVWGALGLYREPDRPLFSVEEQAFIRALSPHLTEGARRGLLMGEAVESHSPDAPGLVVLTEDWRTESTTPGVERWLETLPDGDVAKGKLPSAVYAVAGRALRTADHPDVPGEVAVSRVLGRDGTWIVLHGAALVSNETRRVAVIVEPAHPAKITPLLMSVYRLSEREKDVTRHVLQGASTAQIAETLHLSVHTVQQHLKSIFEKTGVRSRRDLVGKVFFSHYEPRVRDNEHRALEGRHLLGDPVVGEPVDLP